MKRVLTVTIAVLLALWQPACVVAGYSNRGGWFVWPGSLGLLLIVVLVVFLFSRRRR